MIRRRELCWLAWYRTISGVAGPLVILNKCTRDPSIKRLSIFVWEMEQLDVVKS
ncbi:unnamed protein product, partial [Vitis vinifera]|uniref:Uncharacterized protein n=1 Tax=Vitis vinifera TaxID=29760 RepID=D7SUJ3_VITVI